MANQPSADELVDSALIDQLRNPATHNVAWPKVRAALRLVPERVAPILCTHVARWLDAGEAVPMGSLMLCLEAATRETPEIVPTDLLRRVVADTSNDWVATLSAAAMLVRHHPAAILTDGINAVLDATDHALEEMEDDDDSAEYLRALATQLWEAVAQGDPPSIVAIAEAWASRAGWQRRSVRLFVKLMIRAASLNPELVGDSIAVLEKIRDAHAGSSGPFDSPSDHLRTLEALGDSYRRKRIAEEIVAALDPARFRGERPPAPVGRSAAKADPRVDRLIEQFLQAKEWRARMSAAERRRVRALRTGAQAAVTSADNALLGSEPPDGQLLAALTRPWPALVDGVCELVDELIEREPTDARIPVLVSLLCSHPELVPADVFQRWLSRTGVFDTDTRSGLYECLAQLQPAWIVEHALPDAVGTSTAARSSTLWRSLGPLYPELLLSFAAQWFARVEWDRESLAGIRAGLEALASARPEHVDGIRRMLEEYRGPAPEPGTIDFRYIELSSAIESLRRIQREHTP